MASMISFWGATVSMLSYLLDLRLRHSGDGVQHLLQPVFVDHRADADLDIAELGLIILDFLFALDVDQRFGMAPLDAFRLVQRRRLFANVALQREVRIGLLEQ